MDNATLIIRDALSKLRCGGCEHYLDKCNSKILGQKGDYVFAQGICPNCGATFLMILYQIPREEFKSILPIISEDYQIEMGKFLEAYNGDMRNLLGGKR